VSVISSRKKKAARLLEIVLTILHARNDYEMASIDVFSGRAFVWAEIAAFLLRRLNKPYLLVLRGGGLADFAAKHEKRISGLLSAAAKVITPSRYLQSALGVYRQDIRYLPNGLELSQYSFRVRKNPSPRLCWLRAFHRIYNPELAVEVVALLVRDFPEMRLTMMGPDKHDGSLAAVRRMIAANHLDKNVAIVGPVMKQDVPDKLQEHDIFLNTTNLESFGVAVMEAAACGLPIVTTNVGELPYLWSHKKNAMLVPPDNPEAMADAIKMILTDAHLSAKLSENAAMKARQYDYSHIMREWVTLFLQVIQSDAEPDDRLS